MAFDLASLISTVAVSEFCVGVLVHSDAVLTAAHCPRVAGFDVTDSMGRIIYRRVVTCVAHPDGAPGAGRDGMLCSLEPSRDGSFVTATIAQMSHVQIDHPKAVVVRPRRLACGRRVDLLGLDADLSDRGADYEVTADVYCRGDSGAPVFVLSPDGAQVLGGILSHSLDPDQRDCSPGTGIFTKVAALEPWLSSLLEKRSVTLAAVTQPARSASIDGIVAVLAVCVFITIVIGVKYSTGLQK